MFKTHVDIFDKWDDSIVARLQALATKHGKPISADTVTARGRKVVPISLKLKLKFNTTDFLLAKANVISWLRSGSPLLCVVPHEQKAT